MALWVARAFGKITSQPQWLESKKSWFGVIVGSHGRHQRKWCESFQSEAQQRSTGLKKEHFTCGQWSSLQRLSLAYLALPCPLLSLVSHCHLTIVTLWYSLLSCSQLLYYHPPDIIQSCCVIINLPVPRVSQKSCGGVSPWTSETSLSQCAWMSSETPEGRPRCSPECSPFSAGVDDAPECHTHETASRCGQHGLLNATSQRLMGERKYLQKKWDLQV